MRSILLTDNNDTLVGLRLAGIEGKIIDNKKELMENINESLNDEEVGLIIITQDLMDLARDEIMEVKLQSKKTLIISIPKMGQKIESNFLTDYIQESIGLNL